MLKRYSDKTRGLALSFGTLLHLILDQMWHEPKTLLWPIFGIGFERIETTYWLVNILRVLLEEPGAYVPELAGFVVLVSFVWELIKRRAIIRFLRKGRIY